MKQFDDIFRDKVKDVFSNYNADHLAGKGWKSFMSRQKKRSRGLAVLPFWAKAASVVIIVTAGSLLTYRIAYRQDRTENFAVQNTPAEGINKTVADPTSGPSFQENSIQATAGKTGSEKVISGIIKAYPGNREVNKTVIIPVYDENKEGVAAAELNIVSAGNVSPDLEKEAPEKGKEITDTERRNALVEEALEKFLAADSAEISDSQVNKREKKSAILAGVSGMMAVIDNALTSAPGVAAGFYYEYRLSRRFSLRPGMAIAMHSSSIVNTSSGRKELKYIAPAYDGATGITDSYDARLSYVALEVPVDIVFKVFSGKKSDFYLAAGASTVINLNQHFTGTFLNSYTREVTDALSGESSLKTTYSTVEVEKTEGAFSHTDYFGLANISAGYSVPFGSKSSLLIEPYVQVPLSGITSLDVKIFYSGMSLKMRFGK
ncbi:MAG: PorT family protein [Bacteroidales bacterium]|nr:PorT family protein [Bacteroidales bacterium]